MARDRMDRTGQAPEEIPDELRFAQAAHEFEMGGHRYRCHALKPLEQVHLARRLAPILLAALRPEDGRKAILARLMKIANLAGAAENASQSAEEILNEALDLAVSVFSAAAAADESTVDTVIRQCMRKIFRSREGGAGTSMWNDKLDAPSQRDTDGFAVIGLVARYLVSEFRGVIAEHIAGLGLKPGPALMAAAGLQRRPPGAPGA